MTAPTTDQLVALLVDNLPRRPELRVSRLDPLGAGWETDLYLAQVEFTGERGKEAERLVARLYHGRQGTVRAEREFELMRRLRTVGIPVPQVIQLIAADPPLEASLIVMEHIAGPDLRNRLEGQPEAEVLSALDRLAGLLLQIHQVPPEQMLPAASPETPATLMRDLRSTTERYRLAEFVPLLRWLESHPAPEPSTRPALLHNDYHPENVLVQNGGLVVIDWSFAGAGDYRLDLAWTVLLAGTMLGEHYRQPVLESYARQRGEAVAGFERYEALKLGARMLTLLTWLNGAVEIPVHRITPEAMRGDYKVHVLNPYRRLKQITGVELPSLEALGDGD